MRRSAAALCFALLLTGCATAEPVDSPASPASGRRPAGAAAPSASDEPSGGTALPGSRPEPPALGGASATPTVQPTGPLPVEPDPQRSIGGPSSPREATELPTAGAVVLTVDDPRGDVVDADEQPQRAAPVGRAEILDARLRVGDRIELEVTVANPLDPRRWDPFDEVVWQLVDADGDAFTADLRRYSPGPRAEVRDDAGEGPGPLRCEARWALTGGRYRLAFPADCIGDPETLSARVRVQAHDRESDAYAIDRLPGDTEELLGPLRP